MMRDTVIRVSSIGKKYQLGTIGYGSLRRDLQARWAKLRGKEDPNVQIGEKSRLDIHGDFWALKDICFEIQQGERLGVIGRNGAGKSTLLKILSKITRPTEGIAQMKGKVAGLLEVGTGFHPELTGRENVFLNGAILGMKRREIQKKFDEIVNFADVEQFIDTPVKRYSSGMYVRLGFAVSAHLEPDILLVDEVLAVGDISFQQKCLGLMEEASEKKGRTIIFVSHSMAAISSLCNRCILLSNGRIESEGRTSEIILRYYSANGRFSAVNVDYTLNGNVIGDLNTRLLSASIEDTSGRNVSEFTIHDKIFVTIRYRVLRKSLAKLVPNFHFLTVGGYYAFASNAPGVDIMEPGDYTATCEIPSDLLNEGTYFVGVAVTAYFENSISICFYEKDALSFHVKDPLDERSNRYGLVSEIPGVVRPILNWKIEPVAP